MGNKQTKTSSSDSQASQKTPPDIALATESTDPLAPEGNAHSAPPVPKGVKNLVATAEDIMSKEINTTEVSEKQMATAPTESRPSEEKETKQEKNEKDSNSPPPATQIDEIATVAEVNERPTQKIEMPPLQLDQIGQIPPEQPVEEDDPDLMKPPPFLTDAIGPISENASAKKTTMHEKQEQTSDQLYLASPVLHDTVSLDPPTPLSEEVPIAPEPDSISIDEEVSAADTYPPVNLVSRESTSEPPTFVTNQGDGRTLGDVPEDTISLTSSMARGEDELLKNIMGTSVAMHYATSNESARGSYAVSELTIDGTQWELARGMETPARTDIDLPRISVLLNQHPDGTVTLHFIYNDPYDLSSQLCSEETRQVVKTCVDSAFANVLEKVTETERKQDQAHSAVQSSEVKKQSTNKSDTQTAKSTAELAPPSESSGKLTMQLEEVNGAVKITLDSSERETRSSSTSNIQKVASTASSLHDSIELKTPFTNLTDLEELPHTKSEEVIPETIDEESAIAVTTTSALKVEKSTS